MYQKPDELGTMIQHNNTTTVLGPFGSFDKNI